MASALARTQTITYRHCDVIWCQTPHEVGHAAPSASHSLVAERRIQIKALKCSSCLGDADMGLFILPFLEKQMLRRQIRRLCDFRDQGRYLGTRRITGGWKRFRIRASPRLRRKREYREFAILPALSRAQEDIALSAGTFWCEERRVWRMKVRSRWA